MAEPAVQNLSSWNDTQVFKSFLTCATWHAGIRMWVCCCCICFVLGIPASLVVLRELFRRRRQGTSTDFFMLNLYFTDLIFSTTLFPAVCNIMVAKNLEFFVFMNFIHCLPICGRPLLMACICGDCYLAVVHPITYKNSKNASMIRKAVTFTVWFLIFCFGALLCTVNDIYASSLISGPLVVALPVIMFCDISMLRALQKPNQSGNNNIHPQKRQALDTIFNSFVMTLLAYLPPVIIFTFAEVLPISKEEVLCNITLPGICFYVVGCVIMPLLYLHSVGKMDYCKSWLRKKIKK